MFVFNLIYFPEWFTFDPYHRIKDVMPLRGRQMGSFIASLKKKHEWQSYDVKKPESSEVYFLNLKIAKLWTVQELHSFKNMVTVEITTRSDLNFTRGILKWTPVGWLFSPHPLPVNGLYFLVVTHSRWILFPHRQQHWVYLFLLTVEAHRTFLR